MKNLPYMIVIVCLVALSGLAGWYVGKENGQAKGYADGRTSRQSEVDNASRSTQFATEEYSRVLDDYNKLVDDYNTLADRPVYVQQATQTRQSLNCTSYDYGMSSTSTTCY